MFAEGCWRCMCCYELFQLRSVVLGLFCETDPCKAPWAGWVLLCFVSEGSDPRKRPLPIHHLLPTFSLQRSVPTREMFHFLGRKVYFIFFPPLKVAPVWMKDLKRCYSCAICCCAYLCRQQVVSHSIKAILQRHISDASPSDRGPGWCFYDAESKT